MEHQHNSRFTRDSRNKWRIAADQSGLEYTTVGVARQGRGGSFVVPMALGAPVGTKIVKGHGLMHLYEIDRRRGAKAPTGGTIGENGEGQGQGTGYGERGTGGSTGGRDEYDEGREKLEETERELQDIRERNGLDLSEYATKTELAAVASRIDTARRITVEVVERNKIMHEITGAHVALARVLRNITAGNNVFLAGPAGSGKTHLAGDVARALGINLYITGSLLTKYEAIGFIDGRSQYVRTVVRDAYEFGGLILFDEIDGGMPAALVALNAMISQDEYSFPDGVVKKHPDFKVLAAGNTWGRGADRQYTGRMQLDAATLNRFAFIEVGYDEGLEHRLAMTEYAAFGGTDTEQAERFVRLVQRTRKLALENDIRSPIVSPRQSMSGVRLLAVGSPWKEAVEDVLVTGMDEDTVRTLELQREVA